MAGVDKAEADEPRDHLLRLIDGTEWKISERHAWRVQEGVMSAKHPRRGVYVILENPQTKKTFAVRLAVQAAMWWTHVPMSSRKYSNEEAALNKSRGDIE